MNSDESVLTLTAAQRAKVSELESTIRSFQDMVELIGLDKARDFRFADLSGADFSFGDLRGFDFTGSDLSYSYGLDARWDESTNFSGCDLSGSMFAYPQIQKEFFSEARYEVEFNTLIRSEWSEQILGMYKLYRSANSEKVRHFSKRLFLETGDTSVRSDMLRILGAACKDSSEYADFLIYICCQADASAAILAARTLSNQFSRRRNVQNFLLTLIKHNDERVREIAYTGLFQFDSGVIRDAVQQAISTEKSALVRRLYVAAVAQRVREAEVVVRANRGGNVYYDFGEPISNNYLNRQAIRHGKSYNTIIKIVAELIEAGIPFKADDSVLRSAIENARKMLPLRQNEM